MCIWIKGTQEKNIIFVTIVKHLIVHLLFCVLYYECSRLCMCYYKCYKPSVHPYDATDPKHVTNKCSKSYAHKRYRPSVHHYKCTKRCAHYYKCKNVSSCCYKHKFYRWVNLWYQWMGHVGVDNLKLLAKMTCKSIFHQQGCRIGILWRLCA
jgi:hypothetical protein